MEEAILAGIRGLFAGVLHLELGQVIMMLTGSLLLLFRQQHAHHL